MSEENQPIYMKFSHLDLTSVAAFGGIVTLDHVALAQDSTQSVQNPHCVQVY